MSQLRLNKVATPSSPAANKAAIYYSSSLTPNVLAAIDESGNILRLGGFGSKDYRLVNAPDASRTILNGTTTFTPTSGASALYVECVGAGGAGGGAAAGTAATNFGSGGGGGGGGWSSVWETTLVTGAHGSVAVGAGGTAGTAGANAGNNGGDTTFTSSAAAAICVGKGGTGGASAATSAALGIRSFGGAGGVAGTGDRTVQGQDGFPSIVYAPTQAATGAQSGRGGSSGMGYGHGAREIQTSGAGTTGLVYGGGGSGAVDSAATARSGGAGANGIIRIWEYA